MHFLVWRVAPGTNREYLNPDAHCILHRRRSTDEDIFTAKNKRLRQSQSITTAQQGDILALETGKTREGQLDDERRDNGVYPMMPYLRLLCTETRGLSTHRGRSKQNKKIKSGNKRFVVAVMFRRLGRRTCYRGASNVASVSPSETASSHIRRIGLEEGLHTELA